MRIDMHCHVIGNGKDIENVENDVYLSPGHSQHWLTRLLANLIEEDLERMEADLNSDGTISAAEYFELLYRLLCDSSEIDAVVLLALDAVYDPETGVLDKEKTDLWVSNRFLSEKVKELNERLPGEGNQRRFFFGASVSPNRRDWQSELEFVITETEAVLIKLIPSAQHIHLMDDRHREFYRALSEKKMPLLCHVGPEYSFPEGIGNRELDDYRFLEKPLDCGVTVIAAHCASPVFPLIDSNVIKDFAAFMEAANSGGETRLWADTSALSLSTRAPLLSEILHTFPHDWLVNGSDFPVPIDGWTHLPLVTHDITPDEYVAIRKTKNPLDRDVRIKRAHGFSDSILENGEKVLRLRAD